MTSTRQPSTQPTEPTDDLAALQELPEPYADHDTADPTCATTGVADGDPDSDTYALTDPTPEANHDN